MARPAVIFFDAAGTLFHVKGSVGEIYLSYAKRFGVPQTTEMRLAVESAFRRAFHDAPPPVFAAREPAEIKRCERLWWFDVVHNVFYRVGMFEGFDDYFEDIYQAFESPAHWQLYPETRRVLSQLKADGYELGIVSNFDTRLYSVLRGLGLADVFDSITLSSLAHAAKPAPAIFRAALEEHAVDPDEAIHVGDSPRDDVEGAREAGLRAVWLCRSGAADEARQPSRDGVTIIGSLDEVAAIVGAK